MVSRSQLFAEISALLQSSDTESGRFDARCIFEDAFGKQFPQILMDSAMEVPENIERNILEMAKMRAEGHPLQYILGQWEFFGYPFRVGEGVLIPRPDTETLVEQVMGICRQNNITAPKIADLCSGSGCIAITLKKELPDAQVFAVELSEKALPYLKENALLCNADIHIVSGDVLSHETAEKFRELDIIVSNPPYLTEADMNELQREVAHEPSMALFGGNDGLDFYRKITPLWKNSLKSSGFIAYEFGQYQHDAVSEILTNNGFENIQLCRDAAGIIRTAAAQKS